MYKSGRTARPPAAQEHAIPDPDRGAPAPEDYTDEDAVDSAEEPADDNAGDHGRDAPPPRLASDDYREAANEQDDFREHFDEDLYTDREERPAQGNTADVAMGEQRFGSDADAYAEYAWRRSGDHHHGEESAVGQSRDPADSRGDDTPR